MDINHGLPLPRSNESGSPKVGPVATVDPKLQPHPQHHHSPTQLNHFSSPNFTSPPPKIDMMSDFMHIGNEFLASEPSYSDMAVWPDYSLDLGHDMYPNSLGRDDLDLPTFPEFSDASLSEPLTASSSGGSDHTREISMPTVDFEHKVIDQTMCIPKGTVIPEFEVVIAAENSWPLARCNQPKYSADCPRTGIVHLEVLEKKCKQDGTWDKLAKHLQQSGPRKSAQPAVVPITSRTRDKMTAITQSFLQKALGVHRGGVNGHAQVGYSDPNDAFNFIMLPPNEVLEYFLGSYVRSLSDYYPLAFAMRVDPNEMLQNNQASTLQVLLMIAQGAAAEPMEEARYLSAGLTETSRISLFDIIEKDVELCAHPVALRCALLFTHLGAWSGDKWQMDIAMGQRGMYLSVS